ncbi:MAG: ribonucleotide reductase subunit alpha [Gammaproteobacteria bacterium]|nr:ribonucleotide reductase subunit alpha [Gammaproteobacteria bacterium]MDH5591212.1 ribonucleotide reductase subunit alpha [Gammaproteobacteria bacterium]
MFVFLQSSLSESSKEEQAKLFQAGQGGELHPVMCVDKRLDELSAFSALVAEAQNMEQDWQIVLIGCLSGANGNFPSSDEAEQPLMKMVQAVQNGGDLSKYLAFDKNGTLLQFS